MITISQKCGDNGLSKLQKNLSLLEPEKKFCEAVIGLYIKKLLEIKLIFLF